MGSVTGSPLGSRRWIDMEFDDPPLLLVPLGSTEQHGPHLPFDTDTRIAVAWANAMAQDLDHALVAPALPYGSSGEHQGFPGTLSIGQQALESLLVELIRSAGYSFAATFLICGHVGNLAPVSRAVARLTAEGHDVWELFPTWDEASVGITVDAHAGRVETSLMLHIAPETVHLSDAAPGATQPIPELLDDLRTGGVAAVSPNGVLGDPYGADPEEGRRLLDDLVARSIETVQTDLRG